MKSITDLLSCCPTCNGRGYVTIVYRYSRRKNAIKRCSTCSWVRRVLLTDAEEKSVYLTGLHMPPEPRNPIPRDPAGI